MANIHSSGPQTPLCSPLLTPADSPIMTLILHRSLAAALLFIVPSFVAAQSPTAKDSAITDQVPRELVEFGSYWGNPVFKAAGEGHWDARIRERGWIIREGREYRMWYTGYDGTREGQKMLGLATSQDCKHWTRHPKNPIYKAHWVEDMMVLKHEGTYYMFAEGEGDQAQMLTSPDGVEWKREGTLDVRLANGEPIPAGPFGTPFAMVEDGVWYLFYERRDAGVWLATSKDRKVWTNVQDEPVLKPGPQPYDKLMIALNQVIKYQGKYYALLHGTGSETLPRLWGTGVAVSSDLIHWSKFAGNPLFPIAEDKSSGMWVFDGRRYGLCTMHNRVDLHLPMPAEPSGQ